MLQPASSPATRASLLVALRRRGRRSCLVVALFIACAAGLFPAVGHSRLDGDLRGGCAGSAPREAYAQRTFLGYACRDADCAAHKAGFAWADRNGITDAKACADVEDPAFGEGCRAFVEESVTAEQSGFVWARENEVGDACRCGGAGPRFEAGCAAYVTGFAR